MTTVVTDDIEAASANLIKRRTEWLEAMDAHKPARKAYETTGRTVNETFLAYEEAVGSWNKALAANRIGDD